MRKVVISQDAESELELIYGYLSIFGARTADRFLDAYEECVSTLEEGVVEHPLSRHPELRRSGYRVALVNSYLVLYRVAAHDEVHVAHVFHQSQDYAKLVTGLAGS